MAVTALSFDHPDIISTKRALLSVFDKTGLVELARMLHQNNVELLSTGGTARALRDAGLPVKDVTEITGFPEIMDGRVKTLHPGIHGGLLGIRDHNGHATAMEEHQITAIDLLIVNLYPFKQVASTNPDYHEAIENIDIGGPAMVRAGAKNHAYVSVVTHPEDYHELITEISEHGGTGYKTRQKLAAKAFAMTALYDTAVSNWFNQRLELEMPQNRSFGGELQSIMRYGENPHQQAGFYTTGHRRFGVANARQIQGKQLSFNNINDTNAAFELVSEFDPNLEAAVAIIKHANPCGVAAGPNLAEAYHLAHRCDPVSAFGGIIALNRPLDAALARDIVNIFTEVIIAPGVEEEAARIIAEKKNLRLLVTDGIPERGEATLDIRSVAGGFLVQERDVGIIEDLDLQIVTKRAPSDQELADLRFAFKVAKHVKSNAIIYAKNGATVGVGAGQMSRIDSSRIAARKAVDATKAAQLDKNLTIGSVVASDAFFPFADGLLQAVEAGATAIIQPGGSMRDDEVIAAADDAGLAMVFTGMRHFRH